jgi:hypothetical protein
MFTVTGKNATGVTTLERDTAVGAIKKAVELMGDGHADVRIIAPDGRVYGHAEFRQLFAAGGA